MPDILTLHIAVHHPGFSAGCHPGGGREEVGGRCQSERIGLSHPAPYITAGALFATQSLGPYPQGQSGGVSLGAFSIVLLRDESYRQCSMFAFVLFVGQLHQAFEQMERPNDREADPTTTSRRAAEPGPTGVGERRTHARPPQGSEQKGPIPATNGVPGDGEGRYAHELPLGKRTGVVSERPIPRRVDVPLGERTGVVRERPLRPGADVPQPEDAEVLAPKAPPPQAAHGKTRAKLEFPIDSDRLQAAASDVAKAVTSLVDGSTAPRQPTAAQKHVRFSGVDEVLSYGKDEAPSDLRKA